MLYKILFNGKTSLLQPFRYGGVLNISEDDCYKLNDSLTEHPPATPGLLKNWDWKPNEKFFDPAPCPVCPAPCLGCVSIFLQPPSFNLLPPTSLLQPPSSNLLPPTCSSWSSVLSPGSLLIDSSHYTPLHCTVLHCTALHCTALHCTAHGWRWWFFVLSSISWSRKCWLQFKAKMWRRQVLRLSFLTWWPGVAEAVLQTSLSLIN